MGTVHEIRATGRAGGRQGRRTMKTCIDHGEKHTWERRGHSGGGPFERTGCFVFLCTTCTAWGWAPTAIPAAIRQYEVDTFRSREPGKPEITAIPSAWHREEQAKVAVDLDVDRRRAPRPKRVKGEYQARFTIEDWDRT